MPRFLTYEEVVAIHQRMISLYGGSAGLRDKGMLESAVGMPTQMFFGAYAHEDLPAMAGAYLFHLAMNHPFVDGNKRVAAGAAVVFLGLNGLRLEMQNPEYADLVLAVASGQMGKDDLILKLRAAVRPVA
jgi:death-on-curing protein